MELHCSGPAPAESCRPRDTPSRASLINNIRTFETLVSSVVNWSNSIIYIHENIGRMLLCRKVRSSPYRIHCISQASVHYLKILDISSCWGLHLTPMVSYIYPFIKDNLYTQVFIELPYQGLSFIDLHRCIRKLPQQLCLCRPYIFSFPVISQHWSLETKHSWL